MCSWHVLMRAYVFRTFEKHQEASNMRFKFLALIATIAVPLALSGCNNNENTTTNTNTSVNRNANVAVATSTPIPTNTANDNRRAPTREEYERNRRYTGEAKESGGTVGTGLMRWIWVKARSLTPAWRATCAIQRSMLTSATASSACRHCREVRRRC